MEVILARIDAPRPERLRISLFNQIIFDLPQLFQFISRTPTLRVPEEGYIGFKPEVIYVKFPVQTPNYGIFIVEISSTTSEWRVSSLEQVCTSSLPRWMASTYLVIHIGHHVGKMMLKTRYGWIFYVHLLP